MQPKFEGGAVRGLGHILFPDGNTDAEGHLLTPDPQGQPTKALALEEDIGKVTIFTASRLDQGIALLLGPPTTGERLYIYLYILYIYL